jgi:hypothetical protein
MVNDPRSLPADVTIQLVPDDLTDPDRLDAIAASLRAELDELSLADSITSRTRSEAAPPGAKGGGEVVTLGAIALAVLPVALPGLIDFLKQWVTRPDAQPVRLEVESKDGRIKVEYDPKTASASDVTALVHQLSVATRTSAES